MSQIRKLDPTRFAWVRSLCVWLALVWILTSPLLIGYVLVQHNHDLNRIQQVQQQYIREQRALGTAGTDQLAFAVWLAQVDVLLCQANHLTCPPLPNIKGLP